MLGCQLAGNRGQGDQSGKIRQREVGSSLREGLGEGCNRWMLVMHPVTSSFPILAVFIDASGLQFLSGVKKHAFLSASVFEGEEYRKDSIVARYQLYQPPGKKQRSLCINFQQADLINNHYKLMNLTLVLRQYLDRTSRQATFWKAKHYSAIPHYVKPHFIDIHDSYQLRTHEEVLMELREKEFQVKIERIIYKPTDIRQDLKGRKAILIAPIAQFSFTEMQLARLKVLMAGRLNEQTQELKLTCQQFPDYEQNYTKIHEMFHDIIMEAKRAP